MDLSCKSIPVQPWDRFGIPARSTNCDLDQTARSLYDDVSKSVVFIETGNTPSPRARETAHVGSGFFVNQGDEIVTNAHVALSGTYVDVYTPEGKRYSGQIEKVDEMNDLARIKLIGASADPTRALVPDATPLKPDEELIAFGHPGGQQDVWASSGMFKQRAPLQTLVANDRFPDFEEMKRLAQSSHPTLAAEAKNYLATERLQMRINIANGNSGSAVVDEYKHLRAVAANRISSARGLAIPADKVADLISTPDTKFSFNYAKEADGQAKLVSVIRKDGDPAPILVLKKPEPIVP